MSLALAQKTDEISVKSRRDVVMLLPHNPTKPYNSYELVEK